MGLKQTEKNWAGYIMIYICIYIYIYYTICLLFYIVWDPCEPSHSIRCPRAEGPSIYWITQRLYLTYNCVPQHIWGYFAEMCNKSHWILQRHYRLTVCNRRAFALSRRCLVSRSRPRVFRDTMTAISLWPHHSDLRDNAESIVAHSNAIPRTMGCITI